MYIYYFFLNTRLVFASKLIHSLSKKYKWGVGGWLTKAGSNSEPSLFAIQTCAFTIWAISTPTDRTPITMFCIYKGRNPHPIDTCTQEWKYFNWRFPLPIVQKPWPGSQSPANVCKRTGRGSSTRTIHRWCGRPRKTHYILSIREDTQKIK